MEIPDRIVTLTELRRNNGDLGRPKYIAYAGIVYEVTEAIRWRGDLHEGLHFPGQDLTSELPGAPHDEDVFTHRGVRVIGRLEGGER